MNKIYKILRIFPLGLLGRLVANVFAKPYKKVIFVATTGRSGSGSLYEIARQIPNFCAFHEPKPIMNGAIMNKFNNGHSFYRNYVYNFIKLPSILLQNLNGKHDYYIESNHMFIKSFSDCIYKNFEDNLVIICLYRDVVKTAMSLYALNAIPGKNQLGKTWYMDYKNSQNILMMKDELENLYSHDFYKCLWYCYEVYFRIIDAKSRYPKATFIKIQTEELSDSVKLKKLFFQIDKSIDISPYQNNTTTIHNEKKDLKINYIDKDEAESMHLLFVQFLKSNFKDYLEKYLNEL